MGRKLKNGVLGRSSDDPKVNDAVNVLRRHFLNKKNKPIRTPYYRRQLQVLYEGDFFDWVVGRALTILVDEKYLTMLDKNNVPELAQMDISKIKFYVNSKAMQTKPDQDRIKRRVINIAKEVKDFSSSMNNRVRGDQLESLVKNQLQIFQFEIIKVGVKTKKYKDKEWTKTGHRLDFIARKKGTNFVIGVEVKNTLSPMNITEISAKMDMCEHLGIIPVFAVRWLKPYLNYIRSRNGFVWTFKTQIYPFGYRARVHEWYKKFSVCDKTDSRGHPLKFPINVRNDLPEKSVKIFYNWVQKQIKL